MFYLFYYIELVYRFFMDLCIIFTLCKVCYKYYK
ncbi:hypothetical protein [Magpiepox virus 2]|nr:hypothetical protein [Magpiepox virus 2]